MKIIFGLIGLFCAMAASMFFVLSIYQTGHPTSAIVISGLIISFTYNLGTYIDDLKAKAARLDTAWHLLLESQVQIAHACIDLELPTSPEDMVVRRQALYDHTNTIGKFLHPTFRVVPTPEP